MVHIEVSTFILKFWSYLKFLVSHLQVELHEPWTSFKGVGSVVCYLNNEQGTSDRSTGINRDPGSTINQRAHSCLFEFCSNSVRLTEIKRTQSVWQKRIVRNSETKKMHQRCINEQAQRYHLPECSFFLLCQFATAVFTSLWLSHLRDRTNETTWKHPFYDYFVGITRRGVTPFEVGYAVRKVFVISVISISLSFQHFPTSLDYRPQ
jgi:hypothetical protein